MEGVKIVLWDSSSRLLGHPTAFRAFRVNLRAAVVHLRVTRVMLVSTKEKRMRRLATLVPLVFPRVAQQIPSAPSVMLARLARD
jgi:hypothetical protein